MYCFIIAQQIETIGSLAIKTSVVIDGEKSETAKTSSRGSRRWTAGKIG